MNAIFANKGQIALNRRTLMVLGALGVIVIGAFALWRYVSNPPKPWLVRWRVQRFLKSQCQPADFKVEFPFPTRVEMAAKPAPKKPAAEVLVKGKLTGKDFDALKSEYIKLQISILGLERKAAQLESELKDKASELATVSKQLEEAQSGTNSSNVSFLQTKTKYLQERMTRLQTRISNESELKSKQEALAPLLSDLWDFQRAWLADEEAAEAGGVSRLTRARNLLMNDLRQRLDEASSYAEIYRAIGEQLWVAHRLFESANSEHRRIGLSLALQASQNAQNDAQNGWLAGRICEGYIWPHIDVADDRNRRSAFNPENLLNQCADIFRKNEEWQNVILNYKLLLAMANTPQVADSARVEIANAHEQVGDPKHALEYLRAIKLTNDFARVLRRIPRLERQVKGN